MENGKHLFTEKAEEVFNPMVLNERQKKAAEENKRFLQRGK